MLLDTGIDVTVPVTLVNKSLAVVATVPVVEVSNVFTVPVTALVVVVKFVPTPFTIGRTSFFNVVTGEPVSVAPSSPVVGPVNLAS